jgi:hypothetical protein
MVKTTLPSPFFAAYQWPGDRGSGESCLHGAKIGSGVSYQS